MTPSRPTSTDATSTQHSVVVRCSIQGVSVAASIATVDLSDVVLRPRVRPEVFVEGSWPERCRRVASHGLPVDALRQSLDVERDRLSCNAVADHRVPEPSDSSQGRSIRAAHGQTAAVGPVDRVDGQVAAKRRQESFESNGLPGEGAHGVFIDFGRPERTEGDDDRLLDGRSRADVGRNRRTEPTAPEPSPPVGPKVTSATASCDELDDSQGPLPLSGL